MVLFSWFGAFFFVDSLLCALLLCVLFLACPYDRFESASIVAGEMWSGFSKITTSINHVCWAALGSFSWISFCFFFRDFVYSEMIHEFET
jgi:hypothetical protein